MRLRRAGVDNAARAKDLIAQIEAVLGEPFEDSPVVVEQLADPDAGLLQMLRLAEAARDAECLDLLNSVRGTRGGVRLVALLGGSVALGDFLISHPALIADFADWPASLDLADTDVRAVLLEAVGADPASLAPVATVTGDEGVAAMRVAYRRHLVRIAAEDLVHDNPTEFFPEVAAALAALAGAALEAGLALARAGQKDHSLTRLAIIGMGKTGGRELNYISDVDVIYAAELAAGADEAASLKVATRLAAAAARACDRAGIEPALWEVDANLRPEGKDGALMRTVAAHRAYYERWAQTWEFQALLKARPIAGDVEVGEKYLAAVTPLVWNT